METTIVTPKGNCSSSRQQKTALSENHKGHRQRGWAFTTSKKQSIKKTDICSDNSFVNLFQRVIMQFFGFFFLFLHFFFLLQLFTDGQSFVRQSSGHFKNARIKVRS